MSEEELRYFWAPISPIPYIAKLRGGRQRLLAVSGKYDPTFCYEFSQQFFAAVREQNVECETVSLPCGHYSLGEAPFKWITGWKFGGFLRKNLR